MQEKGLGTGPSPFEALGPSCYDLRISSQTSSAT